MVVERFPRRAWMKQLRRMAWDAEAWEKKYRRMGSFSENDAYAARATDRADRLAGITVQLELLVGLLDELPRLS